MATPMSSTETPDILHPLSLLEWEECHPLPVGMSDAQAVFLDGILHVGGGGSEEGSRNCARLYSCKTSGDGSWTTTDTPTCYYALTTYDFRLVLVGGLEHQINQATNKLYTMIDGGFDMEVLPPMKEERHSSSAVSSGSALVVAGGFGYSQWLSSVEVYHNGEWTSRQSLPDVHCDMKCFINEDEWILIRGTIVHRISLHSLITETEQSSWETLADVPFKYSAVAVFGRRILSIGGESDVDPTTSIHAYSPDTQIWIHVGDLPAPLYGICSTVLPTGELMVLGVLQENYFPVCLRADLKGPTCNRNDEDDMFVRQAALEIENEYLKAEVKQLKSAKDKVEKKLKEKAKTFIDESDTTIKMHKENVQQLLSEIETLRHSQLPAPIKTEAPFNLPGVEVVDQTSVIVTNSEQSFLWTGYGFKLHVPQNSLPAGVNKCLLHISASTAGQYQFPDNMELVSAVYWVRCDPFCRFQQSLTAELQHCAKMTSSTKLTFVRAICSQKDLPYTFKKSEGCGSFTDQSSYGLLLLDHFSGFAIAGVGIERLYIACLYYLVRDLYTREIHFVITWDDHTHTKEVKQYFEEMGAKERAHLEVEFKEKSISLDIPMREGVTVNEWKLTALVPPHLPRRRVDSFKPGKRIPSLQLKASLSQDQTKSIPERSYVVTLQGAREPYNEMVIEIDRFKHMDDQSRAPSTVQLHSVPALPSPDLIGQFRESDNGSLSSALVPYRENSSSSLARLTPGLPSQHIGYYPTFDCTVYPSPYPRRQGLAGAIEYPSVTIDQLVDHVGVSKDLLNKPCYTEHLTTIASLLPNWQKYAENLGLSKLQIQDIKTDILLDAEMKAQRVIDRWYQLYGFKATYARLIEVCLKLKDVPLAEKICRFVEAHPTRPQLESPNEEP